MLLPCMTKWLTDTHRHPIIRYILDTEDALNQWYQWGKGFRQEQTVRQYPRYLLGHGDYPGYRLCHGYYP